MASTAIATIIRGSSCSGCTILQWIAASIATLFTVGSQHTLGSLQHSRLANCNPNAEF